MGIGEPLWCEGLISKGKEFDAAELIGAVMESAGICDRETVGDGCDLVIIEVAAEVSSVTAIATINAVITVTAIDRVVTST